MLTFDGFESLQNNLSDILASSIAIQSKGNVSRVTPGDDGDSGPVQSDIQLFDDVDDELRDVMPASSMHGPGGMQYKRQVYCSVAFYNIEASAPPSING